ncbi:MAG: flagellar filament capping protein FliD [Nitrospina sp.]|nr:flagellar filament capping protein FliD [Nitrospina sp.]MBT3508141.1 flagellar filament capping protein FliD [Nitrospina sp.]MBT3876277.1 flagellar filament capping protein FliD [Nitrospina sp.]MBT4050007.1 flagellar filament capping protein FliD [Nitrospina sp.]MBT4556593.1 flagellar filament capping protein FliD [Nitrospina sp.]
MAQTAIFGINSNLDTGGIIDNLVALQRAPINIVEAKRSIEESKLLSFQDLKGRLQTFKGIVNTLNTDSEFLSTQGLFSNNNSLDSNSVVSLSTSSQASSGTFSLTVNNLARESKLVSEGFASTASSLDQGTLNLGVGASSVTITIDSTNNTLDGLRLAINNSGLNVKASFINDGSSTNPVRLAISGTKSGVDNDVTIGISGFLFGAGSINLVNFTETQTAQNANFVLDGVAITKSGNVISDVIDGTILTLESAGSGTVTLSSDTETIKDNIQNYVDGFNELMIHLNDLLSLNTDTGETSVLFANFTVQNLQQTLRESISNRVVGVSGDFNYLSQIGIRTNSDGTISIDDGDLSDALAQGVGNVSDLFSSNGSTTSSAVTFIGFTSATNPGGYDIQVSNGVPQLATSGSSTFVDATGAGNFFAGAAGTDSEGLNFRISDLSDGSYGKITITAGVAEITNRILANLTDSSLEGPLESEIDTATETIQDFDDTIIDLEERLVFFDENLREKFTNLEVTLGRLNSQKDAFNSSIDGIKALFSGG